MKRYLILLLIFLFSCSGKADYSSVKLIDYSSPYEAISEYYKPGASLNYTLIERIIEYNYNGNTIVVGKTAGGDVFFATGEIYFWIEDYPYPNDNIKITEYKNVLGHDGIIFSFIEGANSSSIIYLYWEDNSIKILAVCNKSNFEVDINGDGISDLISYYNYTIQIIYLYQNKLYTVNIGEIFNTEGLIGNYDAENNRFEFSSYEIIIECFIEKNVLYYKTMEVST